MNKAGQPHSSPKGFEDYDLITRAVEIANLYYLEIGDPSLDYKSYLLNAYRLIYKFLSKQEKPLDPAHRVTARLLLTKD